MHFRTEGGELQRRVIEWFVGELILQTYTFTDRLKYGVPGSEQEMRDLQVATYEARSHFAPIYDLTNYEATMRFANSEAGIRYFRMMALQGVGVLHAHLESVANEARATIRSRAALVDPHIEKAKNRRVCDLNRSPQRTRRAQRKIVKELEAGDSIVRGL